MRHDRCETYDAGYDPSDGHAYSQGRGFPLWPWLVLAAWILFIWGHSLLSGADSSLESGRFVELIMRVFRHFGITGSSIPLLNRLVTDREFLHFVVRKGAHFSEYFVLGILVINALRLTFRNPLLGTMLMLGIWVSVPGIDETIQRFIPDRSGQLSDMLLDMSGFFCGMIACLAFIGLLAIIKGDD